MRQRIVIAALYVPTRVPLACWPSYAYHTRFSSGRFVLWGLGGTLESGAFEALLYDGLAANGDEALKEFLAHPEVAKGAAHFTALREGAIPDGWPLRTFATVPGMTTADGTTTGAFAPW